MCDSEIETRYLNSSLASSNSLDLVLEIDSVLQWLNYLQRLTPMAEIKKWGETRSVNSSLASSNSLDLVLEIDSVHQWLEDVRHMTEMECMCVLQGKSLKPDDKAGLFPVHNIKEGIDHITERAKDISDQFTAMFDRMDTETWSAIRQSCLDITCQIRALIQSSNGYLPTRSIHISEQEETVMAECAKLIQQVENLSNNNGPNPHRVPLINQLSLLGQSFGSMVDLILSNLLQMVVQCLDQTDTIDSLHSAITTVISLGLDGEHMCYMLAREGCMRALFDIVKSTTLQPTHARCLRAISTVSCISESITQLEQCRGIECLTEMLSDMRINEQTRGEAAGVIAQVTSPCMDHFKNISGFMNNMELLIKSLLCLIQESNKNEVFLLSAAAIANITFMDCGACDILLKNGAAKILIDSCRTNKAQSVFSKDQVATVLANMAVIDMCRENIVDARGVDVLVDFIATKHSSLTSAAQYAACERVQQKAAIALTRLSRESGTAQSIIKCQGIPRLVELCRNIAERNDSDAVLVACLAALRKISSSCTMTDVMSTDDIQQLIHPTLMDSFLLCTHKDENFV